MKKYYRLIAKLMVVSILFSGCTDFLDIPPKNTVAVISYKDVKATFSGYLQAFAIEGGNPLYGGINVVFEPDVLQMFEAYSDNIDFENGMSTYLSNRNYNVRGDREKYYADYFLYNQYDIPEKIWNNYYEAIGFLNGMQTRLEELPGGNQMERDQLSGEILMHRSYYIFKLLQYFAPYDKADMGIPVYLDTSGEVVGVSMPRKSHAEVYEIIINDLKKVVEYLAETAPDAEFNVWYNELFVNNLLAQVYWFKAESAAKESSDYENAKIHATIASAGQSSRIPQTKNDIYSMWRGQFDGYSGYFNRSSSFGGVAAIYGSAWIYGGYAPINIPVKSDLTSLYEDTDVRIGVYYESDSVTMTFNTVEGNDYGGKRGSFSIFRPENAYLILAEANYRLGDEAGAISVLDEFKSLRQAGISVGLSGEALLEEIINERRREFFTREDHRWLDLKRYGNKTITRQFTFYDESYSVTVEPNDFRYALPIPITELEENPDMIANPGWTLIEY